MSDNYSAIYIDLNTGKEFYLDAPLNPSFAQFKYNTDVPAYQWVLAHNQNSDEFVINITDGVNEIVPNSVEILDGNTVAISFSQPMAGTALMIFFGNNYNIPAPMPTASPTVTVTITPTPTTTTSPTPTPSVTPSNLPIAYASFNNTRNDTTLGDGPIVLSNQIVDDDFLQIPLPFSFNWFGKDYGKGNNGGIFVGSNGYITFGQGYNNYSGITTMFPPNAINIYGGDRKWEGLTAEYISNNSYRLRFYGSNYADANGSFTYELTFYLNQTMRLTFSAPGTLTPSLNDGTTATICPLTMNAGNSYVIYSDANGSNWQFLAGAIDLVTTPSTTLENVILPSPTPTPTVTPTPT